MPSAADLLERCTFPGPGEPLSCAVSGGADSLALLALACAAGCRVTAIHVDHGLRAGSAGEAAVVASAARRFGAVFRSVRAPVPPGPNLEARARIARRAVLPEGSATGHTMDDQAETVVLNLFRGAGLDGLAGMRPGPVHPLLSIRRSDTHDLCASLSLDPVVDPTNADRRFLRNAVRHDLLPACSYAAGRDLVPVLARQARLLADEASLLDQLSSAIDPADAATLAAAPLPLARRAARRWLRSADHPPDAAAVERVLAVAAGAAAATDVAPGIRVRRRRGRLVAGPTG